MNLGGEIQVLFLKFFAKLSTIKSVSAREDKDKFVILYP